MKHAADGRVLQFSLSKKPLRAFLPAPSTEHFEIIQNAALPERLEKSSLSAAVYLIRGGPCPLELPRCSAQNALMRGSLTVSEAKHAADGRVLHFHIMCCSSSA